ncbi:MAG TPA: ATP-binding protein, partial [Candidatus Binatia bacterium]|nr:ATP-binding protein [Candidatus Binatia bacterium]
RGRGPTSRGRCRAPAPPPARRGDTLAEAAVKSATRSMMSTIGRRIGQQILRGVLGSLRK